MQNNVFINEEDLDILKLELVSRKIKNNLLKKLNYYKIDDEDIKYLDDCLNLDFSNNINLKDLILVIKTNKLPNNYNLDIKNIKISLNGIENNSDIVILEPLEYQINNIKKISITDTKLKSNIKLSSKIIILVKDNIDIPTDTNYQIIKYHGDINKILNKILIINGYLPQEIKNNTFVNKLNNDKLRNFFISNYPNILSIDEVELLKERQQKELSIRYEVLSIIRKRDILVIDDIEITSNELVILAEYYKNIYSKEDKDLDITDFTDFINIYGIRLNENGIYLLDDDTLLANEYADNNTVNELYKIYLRTKKNYKERLSILSKRKNTFKSVYNESDLDMKKDITEDELDKLYSVYINNNPSSSVLKFMQDLGIRIDDDEIYLLNDNEAITLIDFIDSKDEDKIASILRKYNEDCYTESGFKSYNLSYLSFDGLEEYFNK